MIDHYFHSNHHHLRRHNQPGRPYLPRSLLKIEQHLLKVSQNLFLHYSIPIQPPNLQEYHQSSNNLARSMPQGLTPPAATAIPYASAWLSVLFRLLPGRN